jgi:hypothetical protein
VPNIYCVLRTLNICDGHEVYHLDRAGEMCLCHQEELAEENGMRNLALMHRQARLRAVDAATARHRQ